MTYFQTDVTRDYKEFIAPVDVTATTFADAQTIVPSNPFSTSDGEILRLEFFVPIVDVTVDDNTRCRVVATEDGTPLGMLTNISGSIIGDNNLPIGLLTMRIAPASAGSHIYAVKAWVTGGTMSFIAGPGGSETEKVPGSLRMVSIGIFPS